MNKELLDWAQAQAKADGRSLSGWLEKLVSEKKNQGDKPRRK